MNILKKLFASTLVLTIAISCDKEEAPQPQPTVSALSIVQGEVGTAVSITGTNFGTSAADVEVTFNGTKATVATVTATQINTSVPAGASTGVVKVKVKLLEASGPSFTVLAPITVNVSPFSLSINENPVNGGSLGTINATTNRGNLTYSLTSQSVAGAMAINSTSGILTVANVAAFDFEVNPTITGVVSVANGSEVATANITITLNNVTDVAVDNFSTTVAENIANSSVIGSMNIQAGAPTFSITSQVPAGALQINATSGQLTVLNSSAFNFEVNPTVTATVTYTGGGETKTASVAIAITNVDEVTIGNFVTSVSENQAVNSTLGVVQASTVSGGTLAFSIVSQTPAEALAINATSGALTVANSAAFDYETTTTITATVSATSLSETKTATVTITLTDVIETGVTVTAIAGYESTTGCASGTAAQTQFTQPFFGQATGTNNANDGVHVTLADLDCGVTRVFIPASGSITSTTVHVGGGGFYSVDAVYGETYSLMTYYSPSSGAGNILKIPTNGGAVSNLLPNNAVFMPTGMTTDANGNIYVAETDGRRIKKFSSNGTLLATYGTGAIGGQDGPAATATFARTRDIQIDSDGNLFVADRSSVRKIDTSGNVTTIAGANNDNGDAIGTAANARFSEIHAIALWAGGILVADHSNNKIKFIDGNEVTTLLTTDGAPRGIINTNDNSTFYFTQSGKAALYKVTVNNGF